MDGTIVSGLLEFGRIVHAEMSALADAARRGAAVQSCILYTNTFPCHMCARQIIASGISEVIFLQPYSKSLAFDLYADSISRDPSGPGVHFKNFVGVTPNSFLQIFRKKSRRKDHTGKIIEWRKEQARTIANIYAPAYIKIEDAIIYSTADILRKLAGSADD